MGLFERAPLFARLAHLSLEERRKGSSSSTFAYGSEHQRTRQTKEDGAVIVYAGAQEVELTSARAVKIVKTYWPMGLGVDIDRAGQTATELRWMHKDRLGSPVAITGETGTVLEMLAYDSWGKRRQLDGSAIPDNLDGVIDNKGFTGHEMLDQLDLVHMNGRVYDPLVARFMSGDPLIQDVVNGQNYNRYSYVLNNPTNFTDPTGFACEKPTGSNICSDVVAAEINKVKFAIEQAPGEARAALTAKLSQIVQNFKELGGKKGGAGENKADAKKSANSSVVQDVKKSVANWWEMSVAGAQSETPSSAVHRVLDPLVAETGLGGLAGMAVKDGVVASLWTKLFSKEAAAEESILFKNKFPADMIDVKKVVPNERLGGISGNFNYVVTAQDSVVVGRSGHTSLAAGLDVRAAGEIQLYNGNVKWIDNMSGHYQPSGAGLSKVVERAFNNMGMEATGKFIYRTFP